MAFGLIELVGKKNWMWKANNYERLELLPWSFCFLVSYVHRHRLPGGRNPLWFLLEWRPPYVQEKYYGINNYAVYLQSETESKSLSIRMHFLPVQNETHDATTRLRHTLIFISFSFVHRTHTTAFAFTHHRKRCTRTHITN